MHQSRQSSDLHDDVTGTSLKIHQIKAGVAHIANNWAVNGIITMYEEGDEAKIRLVENSC